MTWAIVPCLLFLNACGSAPDDAGKQADRPAPNPLVFEISSADGEVEGWMLGTIHALPDGVEWRTSATTRVIDEADLLLVEVADLADSEGIAKVFAQLSTSPDLPDLLGRVSPDKRTALAKLVDKSRFSVSDFRSIETWAAALMLAQVRAQGDPANGVDRAVIVDFDGRDIRELEGAMAQLSIFDELPLADQRDLLEGVVAETQLQEDQSGRLRQAWLTGDEQALEEATTTGIMADKELRDALLIDRNKDWTEQIVDVLDAEDKPLVAVGAAHLVGEDGLPAMLRARGYKVDRAN
ncbi:MAG: TraB/GumN family protein [Pseudomonadota bacterium]